MKSTLAMLLGALAMLSSTSLSAQPATIPAPQRKAIVAAAKHYMVAIACAVGEPNAIASLEPYRLDEASGLERGRFAVLWTGDIGCSGGSASSSMNIAIVEVQFGNHYLVDAKASSPNIDVDLTMQGIDRIVRSARDTIVLEGRELGPDDALCCASEHWRVTLQADGAGSWKTVRRQDLGHR